MNEDYKEILERIASIARRAKYESCEENNGPTDGPPMLLGELEDGSGFMMPDTLDGHPTEHLPMMLGVLEEGLMEKQGSLRWKWLAYVVEGYASPDDPKDYERGDMENDYKTNPESPVREGVIITLFPWDGESMNVTHLYRYDDKGVPVWDDEPMYAEETGGMIPLFFRSFRNYCLAEGDVELAATLCDAEFGEEY